MKNVKRPLITLFLCVFLFAFSTGADAQEEYNHYALEYFKRSLEYLVIGDYNSVIASCNEVLRRDPESSVTFTIRARAFFELGDYDMAIADCTQAIRFDRNNISAYTIRGNSYARKGDMTRANTDWRAVLRINPENNEARINIELASQASQSEAR
jgi:tetratricopeptide (TPR) repeat protein